MIAINTPWRVNSLLNVREYLNMIYIASNGSPFQFSDNRLIGYSSVGSIISMECENFICLEKNQLFSLLHKAWVKPLLNLRSLASISNPTFLPNFRSHLGQVSSTYIVKTFFFCFVTLPAASTICTHAKRLLVLYELKIDSPQIQKQFGRHPFDWYQSRKTDLALSQTDDGSAQVSETLVEVTEP